MTEQIILAFGLVLVIEGLVYALAPWLVERAISSASIRSVLARVPRLAAKALICAGGH